MELIEVVVWAAAGVVLAFMQGNVLTPVDRAHRVGAAVVGAILGGWVTRAASPGVDPASALLAALIAAMLGIMLIELVGRPRAPRPG